MKKTILVIAGLLAAFLILGVVLRFAVISDGIPADAAYTRAFLREIIAAGVSFRKEYGAYPSGDSAEIVAQLSGENPKKIEFGRWASKQKKDGLLLDGWKRPIKLVANASDEFQAHSIGRNGRDESGHGDDIVFSTADLKESAGSK